MLTLDALLTTPAGTAKDIAEVQNRLTAVSRARDILMAGKAGAYKAAMAELDERTKAHWQEQIAPELEDSDENEDDEFPSGEGRLAPEYCLGLVVKHQCKRRCLHRC